MVATVFPLISSSLLNELRILVDKRSQTFRLAKVKYNANVKVTAVVSAPAILNQSKIRGQYKNVSEFDTNSSKDSLSSVSGSFAFCMIPSNVLPFTEFPSARCFSTAVRVNCNQNRK